MAEDVNARTLAANAVVDEWSALDRKVRAAAMLHAAGLRAWTEKHGRTLGERPQPHVRPRAPPCGAAPPKKGAPLLVDPANATLEAMSAAEDAYQVWAGQRTSYLSCLKSKGEALIDAATAAKAAYEDAREDFANYRSTFNDETSAFETAIDAYARKLPSR